MEVYITELVVGRSFIALWYSDDKDGFLCADGRIMTFPDAASARKYAEDKGYDIGGESRIDCRVTDMNDCSRILDLWNIADDAARSVGFDFIGSSSDYDGVYAKLVSGCNLPALGHERYTPKWSPQETGMLSRVIKDSTACLVNALSPVPVCDYVYNALYSGYISADKLRDMVFDKIEACGDIPDWLIDVSLAADNEMLTVIAPYRRGSGYIREIRWQEVVMGYYLLMYREGRIPLRECLVKCGDICDAYWPKLACGEFYAPCGELDKNPSLEADKEFIVRTEALCGGYADIARGQYEYILRYFEDERQE